MKYFLIKLFYNYAMKENAVAVVADIRFLKRHFKKFFKNLVLNGKYIGDLLIITSRFSPTFLIKDIRKNKNIKIIRFKKIRFPKKVKKSYLSLNTGDRPNRFKTKNFQWFKLNLFHPELKKWENILYLDINLTIHHDINGIFKIKPDNNMYAKADGYPNYIKPLSSQFDITHPLYQELNATYDLSDIKYFQTGLMYFDTSIIQEHTIKSILNIANRFPISITNEQGILNLFFQSHDDYIYKELPEYLDNQIIYYYWMVKNKKILITKQLVEQYK